MFRVISSSLCVLVCVLGCALAVPGLELAGMFVVAVTGGVLGAAVERRRQQVARAELSTRTDDRIIGRISDAPRAG